MSSGLVPVPVSEIGVDLPFNEFDNRNADIGIDIFGNALGCPWKEPSITQLPGCTNVIALGPDDVIPANATVVVFVTATTENIDLANSDFNFTNICEQDRLVYVLQSACERTAGAFANGPPASGDPLRTITVISDCGLRGFTYNTLEVDPDDGSFFLVGTNPLGNLGCDLPVIPVTCPPIDTTFFICDPMGELPTVTAEQLSSIYPPSVLSVSFHPSELAAGENNNRITEYTPNGSPSDTLFARIVYTENLCVTAGSLFIEYQNTPAVTMALSGPILGCDADSDGEGEFNLRRWDTESAVANPSPITGMQEAWTRLRTPRLSAARRPPSLPAPGYSPARETWCASNWNLKPEPS